METTIKNFSQSLMSTIDSLLMIMIEDRSSLSTSEMSLSLMYLVSKKMQKTRVIMSMVLTPFKLFSALERVLELS